MNRKAQTVVLRKILGYLVAGIILWAIFFGTPFNEGLFSKTGKEADKILGEEDSPLPTKTLKDIELSSGISSAYTTIRKAFEKASATKDERCIITHASLPLFKDESIAVELLTEGVRITALDDIPRRGRPGKTVVIPNIKPCVVAGTDAAKNFFDNYFGKKLNLRPEFTETTVFITAKDKIQVFGENKDMETKGCCNNQNILYKPDQNHLCFFPTNKIINADEDGIDNDYIKEIFKTVRACN